MCVFLLNENYCYAVMILPHKLFININHTFTLIYNYCCYGICKVFLRLIGHLVNYINTVFLLFILTYYLWVVFF